MGIVKKAVVDMTAVAPVEYQTVAGILAVIFTLFILFKFIKLLWRNKYFLLRFSFAILNSFIMYKFIQIILIAGVANKDRSIIDNVIYSYYFSTDDFYYTWYFILVLLPISSSFLKDSKFIYTRYLLDYSRSVIH